MAELADINLNRLTVFVAVVEAGSLTGAARRLGLAKTMVSAHMQRLEAEVGASLLLRSTRRLNLTDAGEAFYEACRRILRETGEAIAAAGQNTSEPRGTLRVTTPIDYGATVVAPVAAMLTTQYPALNIELIAADHVIDLMSEGIDLAIRVGQLADSGHQAVRIGQFSRWLVASPALLAKAGMPESPDQLAEYPFIALSVLKHPLSWTLDGQDGTKRSVRVKAALSANTSIAVRAAVLAGGGFAMMPNFAVENDVACGNLVRVLPEWTMPSTGIHAVFPAARHRPKKVNVFIDALRSNVNCQN